ncbi:MAG: MBL fold metallo-hydrolase [Deltaproteobacteria bacterium]|nr:MBL fold metallo-hydrolase [Deltaproteobacteria bacterium]
MRFAIIGSGSKGNALVVQSGDSCVVVDCGYSVKEMRRRMRVLGLDDLRGLNGLLITHGHNDHVKGAGTLAGGMGIRTFATAQTQDFCARRKALKNHVPVETGQDFSVGGFSVTLFSTVHDAKGSCGFVLTDGRARLGVCTDLGCVTNEVVQALSGLDALYLEFNYDEHMLRTGPYPAHLKKRIMSRYGHLSNEESGFLLAKVNGPQLERVVLAHLSESNNTERLATEAAYNAVGDDVEIYVAPQSHPSPWFEVRESESVSSAAPSATVETSFVETPLQQVETPLHQDRSNAADSQVVAAISTDEKHSQRRERRVPGQALRAQLFGPVDPAVANALRKPTKKSQRMVQMPVERQSVDDKISSSEFEAQQLTTETNVVRPSGADLAHRIELSWQGKSAVATSTPPDVPDTQASELTPKPAPEPAPEPAREDAKTTAKSFADPVADNDECSPLTTSKEDLPLELPLGDERCTSLEKAAKRRFAKKKTSRSLAVRRQLSIFEDVEMTSTKSR